MDDLISRQEAIKRRRGCDRDCKTCDFAADGDSWCQGEIFVVDLLRVPTADVVERKKGKWIKPTRVPDSMLEECSVCGFNCGAYTFNYCPNCGAEMVGE